MCVAACIINSFKDNAIENQEYGKGKVTNSGSQSGPEKAFGREPSPR